MSGLAAEPFVSPAELHDRLDDVTVVDVRDARDYEELGHVPGAVNVPVEQFRDAGSVEAGMLPDPEAFASALEAVGVDPADDVVAYDGEHGVDAARFVLTAATFGHRGRLEVLDGDVTVWGREYETTTDVPDPEPTAYEVERDVETDAVDRETVEAATDESGTLLVDTRTPAEYEQAHIPGAAQLGWETLVDEATRRLKPRAEIEGILESADVASDRDLLLYCNTARRLSHTYLVLRQLGYEDVGYYEGSLTDWIRAQAPAWDVTHLYERVYELAPEGLDRVVAELGDDVFNRLKLIGLYAQKHDGYFMLRTKVPGGQLTAEQARVVGEVADEFARAPASHGGTDQNEVWGDGYLDVTDRQDVQMHWIEIEDMPEIWDRYEAVGLTTLQACGNSVRNVVGCPAAGIDRHETMAVQPVVESITERFLGDRKYGNLPRKLKVSVTGCHENCARAEINDLGLTPAVKDGRDGFHVCIGGGLSDGPRVASDLDVFVEPEQVVDLVEATADLFIEYGSYLDTAVNRLRYLVAELGVDRVREELESRVDFAFERGGESLTTDYRGDHVGVHEQADGNYYVGLNVPAGRMLGSEFVELATLAAEYGTDEVRLTLSQNVLLPGVAADALDSLRAESLLDRYEPDPGPFTRGLIACTGKEFCSYGVIETKARGVRWARALDEWAASEWNDPPDVVRVHMSGCTASCAQPQLGDVGLRGETYRDELGTEPAADVGLGGDLGRKQFIDWLATEVPTEDVPDAVKRVVREAVAYGEDDAADVAAWVNDTPNPRLHDVITGSPRQPEVSD